MQISTLVIKYIYKIKKNIIKNYYYLKYSRKKDIFLLIYI